LVILSETTEEYASFYILICSENIGKCVPYCVFSRCYFKKKRQVN